MTTAHTIDGRTVMAGRVTMRAAGTALAYTAASGALAFAVLHDAEVRPAHAISWLVIAAAVLCGELIVVDLPAVGQPVRLDMSAVPVVVGALFCTPAGLLAAVLLASAASVVAQLAFGRWGRATPEARTVAGRPPVPWQLDRTVVALATKVLAASAALVVTWWLFGGHPVVPSGGLTDAPVGGPLGGLGGVAAGLVAVAAGAVVYQLCTMAGPLIALAGRHRHRPVAFDESWTARRLALQASGITAYNGVLAALAVLIGRQEIWGLFLLAAPAALFGLWYRSVQVVQRRYDNMQRLYGFTAQLADLPDTEAIVTAALELCRQLLVCRHAQLVLDGGGQPRRWEIPEGAGQPAALMGIAGSALCPYPDAITAPVSLGTAEAGMLVVADHRVPGVTFDRDDMQLLQALSSHLSTVLTSSRRLEQLETAAAERDHQALHDGLTGLANRALFSEWASRELARNTGQQHVAVLVLDLDGFKDINDTLGHHFGDLVLEEIARRLQALSRADLFPARIGGDEFAVLVAGLDGEEGAVAAAGVIAEELARPVSVGDMPLELRATIGIAVAPTHGSDPATLLQRADVAMYSAKAARRSSSLYDPDMERDTRRRLTLGSSLRQALDTGRIEVWYQPVARSATGWTSGCEALLRWRDEDGFIPPSEFIPVAEHTGMIERLTWWTLEHALGELQTWMAEDLCPSVAVNLSTRCLQAPDVMDRIRDLLIASDLPPSALTLEITESLLMSDPELAEELLNQLGLMGVRVAIDDFGTGYSSLSRLKRLPVDTIKIDREFVINMHSDRDDEAIVKATLELARTLGCTVVAEGVETFETWHRLQAFGCQQIQGYILARPMPPQECRQWLRNRRNLLRGPTAQTV